MKMKKNLVIIAAAVCDFRPKTVARKKIKKGTFSGMLELEPTMDILAELGRRKKSQVLVGFAAETDNVEANAREKLRRKHLDLIVANEASAFDSETTEVTLINRGGRSEKLAEMPKADAANAILERVLGRVPRRGAA